MHVSVCMQRGRTWGRNRARAAARLSNRSRVRCITDIEGETGESCRSGCGCARMLSPRAPTDLNDTKPPSVPVVTDYQHAPHVDLRPGSRHAHTYTNEGADALAG
jgi:hypothetical protein